MPEWVAAAVGFGPAGAALLVALDNRRRLTRLIERLDGSEKG